MFGGTLQRLGRAGLLGLVLLVSWAALPGAAETPQVTDLEDDAYRLPAPLPDLMGPKPPNPILSNDTADMVGITFAATPSVRRGHDGGYSVSVAVSGEPAAGYNYVVGGSFAGGACFLVHTLGAGQARRAFVACREGEKLKVVGFIDGSVASIKGGTMTASFSFARSTLPPQLRQDPTIDDLYALSCPVTKQSTGCSSDVLLDFASSPVATFKL